MSGGTPGPGSGSCGTVAADGSEMSGQRRYRAPTAGSCRQRRHRNLARGRRSAPRRSVATELRRARGGDRRIRVAGLHLDRQVVQLLLQFLLPLRVLDGLHGRRDGLQLVLRGVPVALVDELLDLLHLGLGGQRDLVVAGDLLLAEQRDAQPVQRIAGTRAVDDGAETAKAQQRGGDRARSTAIDIRVRSPRRESALQDDLGVALRRNPAWAAGAPRRASPHIRLASSASAGSVAYTGCSEASESR